MVRRVKFDGTFPDEIPSEQSQWATFIPKRNPEFKVHSNLGLAHSAMGQRSLDECYALYQLVDGKWTLHFVYEPPEHCNRCRKAFEPQERWQRYSNRHYQDKGKRPWQGGNVICSQCRARDVQARLDEYNEAQERKRLAELKAKYTD